MKRQKHIEESWRIGADSWSLINFDQLPRNASASRQVAALKTDQNWQRMKMDETSRAIDELIADIEFPPNNPLCVNHNQAPDRGGKETT